MEKENLIKKNGLFIGLGLGVVLLYLLVTFCFQKSQEEKYQFMAKEDFSLFVPAGAPTLGDPQAKVYLIEFLDPECETCRVFHPLVKKIIEAYKGKVQLVVRYAPFHHNSKMAIKVLEAARRQGKYWETLEILFRYQPVWGDHHKPRPDKIFDYLPFANLDVPKLREDMKDPQLDRLIEAETGDVMKLKITKTPSFFVNGRPLLNFGESQLKALIQSEVSKQY